MQLVVLHLQCVHVCFKNTHLCVCVMKLVCVQHQSADPVSKCFLSVRQVFVYFVHFTKRI